METVKIVTPNKYEVTIKKWLTGRERQKINSILWKGQVEEQDVNKVDLTEWQNESLKQHLVEIIDPTIKEDDKKVKGNLLEFVLDLREDDFNFIVDELNKLLDKSNKDLKA